VNRSLYPAAICALAAALPFVPASQAAEFRIPTGFNGHDWGEQFAELPGIRLWHANTAQSAQIGTNVHRNPCMKSATSDCDPRFADIEEPFDTPNTFALAEYYLNADSNPWASSGIRLYAISYLYCASAMSPYMPTPVKRYLHLCGSRVIFLSDKPGELAKQQEGYQSNFGRIVRRLIADYGEPPGYELHGKITVQNMGGDVVTSTPVRSDPVYVLYRWCPVLSDKLRPDCKVTVTLEFEATQGEGTVLFATPELYDFANARHGLGDRKNDIYTLLYNHLGQFQPRQREPCTGKRVCNPTDAQMTAREIRDFEP
jgi:hypothetical protein